MIRYVKKNLNYTHLKIDKLNPEEYHRHVHNRYEFLYFMGGDADYIINATLYHLQPGDLLFIPAYSYHYLKPKTNTSYERICIHFPQDVIPSFLLPSIEKFKSIYHIEKNSSIDCIFSSLLNGEYVQKYSYNDMVYLIEQSLGTILTLLKYHQKEIAVQPTLLNPELQAILNYIDEHITDPLDVEFLMKKFYKSYSWIAHAFTNFLEISPKKYINNKKILYAQQLITTGTPPMRAAELLSFENYVTFYRAYLKFLGKKPNQDYRSHSSTNVDARSKTTH